MRFNQDSYNTSVRRFGKAYTDRALRERMVEPKRPADHSAEAAAQSPAHEPDPRAVLAGCFVILGKLLKQVQENAAAQALTAHALSEGVKEVAKLADVLAAPRTREGIVELPSGKVRMVIKEHRNG